ncbi:MAG: porin family protein [Gemmatimonadales bacterium]
MKILVLGPAMLTALAATPLLAQKDRAGLSVYAGPTLAWFGGSDAVQATPRVGIALGIHVHSPLGKGVSIDPDLTFAYKGSDMTGAPGSSVEAVLTAQLWYLELPVLLRYSTGHPDALRFRFYAGPYIAILAGCTGKIQVGSEVVAQSCSDFPDPVDTSQTFDPFVGWDAGAVAGVGAGVPLFGTRLEVDLRYEQGFVNLERSSTGGTLYNRMVLLGVGVPF